MKDGTAPLTLADIDRFLESSAADEAEKERRAAQAAGHPVVLRGLETAAVLDVYDPFELQPVGVEPDDSGRELLVDSLLPLSEPVLDGPHRGLWSLSFAERRAGL